MISNQAETLPTQPVNDLLLRRLDQLQSQIDQLTTMTRLQFAEWLTVEHAALACDCSYDHIYRAVQSGALPATDISNGDKKAAYRIARSDLTAWMERKRGGKHLPPRSQMEDLKARYLPGVA